MENVKKYGALASRYILAITFIFSGFVKALDPLGTTYKIEDYLHAFGGVFVSFVPLAQATAIILIAIEFVLGVCLLFNVRTRWTVWATLAFYCLMTPLTLYIFINNPVTDCGCFGDAIVLTNGQTFAKNIVLLALCIVLLRTHEEVLASWTVKQEAMICGGGTAAVVLLMIYTLLHLPLIDFRPYKIGNNLPSLMEYPDDAEPDQYDIKLIYSNAAGEEHEFTLENYPKESGWTFVRQNSTLIKKGYEPPIHDFEIVNEDFEDLTEDILSSATPVTLVIMYDLQKSNKALFQKIKSLYERCCERGEAMYIVTGSVQEDIDLLQSALELAIPVCSCDPVTLKTIVRANPGVIVLQDGNVIDKYNLRNR